MNFLGIFIILLLAIPIAALFVVAHFIIEFWAKAQKEKSNG